MEPENLVGRELSRERRADPNRAENFINRELSSLEFNRRVLEEARDPGHPLLERVKFLAICGSNLDEFFMSRVSDLRRQLSRGIFKPTADGMSPAQTIDQVRKELLPLLTGHGHCWQDDLRPLLHAAGIHIHRCSELDEEERGALKAQFEREIFPTLTPLAIDAYRPFPFISNLSINLAVIIRDAQRKERLARIKVPTSTFQRFVRIPDEVSVGDRASGRPTVNFVLLEDLIASNLDLLFPGMEVTAAHPFRVTRDAEIEIQVEESDDMISAVEEGIESRRLGPPVRLEVDKHMPEWMREMLAKKLELPKYLVFQNEAPLSLADFWQMLGLDRPDLKDEPFTQFVPKELSGEDIFSAINQRDYLLFHPYDSFTPVVNLLRQAAIDPEVLAIKISLYRIDKRSPIIEALIEARKNGKQVAAVVELKAKFDEENNINFARTLEQEGVHVVYGPADLKVHSKICMVVRREKEGIARYSHLSSGNYNAVTTKVYGDLGYLTSDEAMGDDVSHLFNALTGYSDISSYRKLLVAPKGLRSGMIERIHREIEMHHAHGTGHLAFKLNGLLDKEIVKALYQASQEGVRIDLNVRGLCSLRPGVKGLSENITVTSIVGRFLEHSRIYYFHNGGQEEVLLGSADMMPRNLDRRVELLFPVQDDRIKSAIVRNILLRHLQDTVKARRLLPDGSYERIAPPDGEEPFDSQKWFIKNRGIWHGNQ
jgi:polyphosphate kinase